MQESVFLKEQVLPRKDDPGGTRFAALAINYTLQKQRNFTINDFYVNAEGFYHNREIGGVYPPGLSIDLTTA